MHHVHVKLMEDRRRSLQRSGRCFVCLRKGHISRNCRSNSRCSDCKRRHHSSICSRNVPTAPTSGVPPVTSSSTTNQQRTDSTAGHNSALNPQAPTPTTTSLWVRTDRAILLQTAKATAFNPAFNPSSPGMSQSVRFVLDTGSQRSYVTNSVKEKLSLVPEGEQCMSILTFVSSEEKPQVCEIVKVGE